MQLTIKSRISSLDDRLPTSRMQSTKSPADLHMEDIANSAVYDPLEQRNIAHPTSTAGSFLHLLKSSLGTGMLAMPAAFKHVGLVTGSIGIILVAIIATHCVHILVSTSREICKQCKVPSMTYTETCEKVFMHGPQKLRSYSRHVRHFADCSMAGVCLGGTSVYVIFIASSLKDIFDNFYPEKQFSVEAYCGVLLLPLILITQIRYLKFLVPFSMLANFCLLTAFGITFYYTFTDIPMDTDAELSISMKSWPLFISTAIFAMEGINVVMPVENEMSKPQHFLGVFGILNVTMACVAILYGVFGVVGYMKYGSNVKANITLHLPQDNILALSAKVLVAIAVFFTYCLQMYAPMDIIWTRLQGKMPLKFHNTGQILLRTISVIFTVVMAVAVPDLGLLISLVGAIFFSTLGLLIPTVIETVHRWDGDLRNCLHILIKNTLLLLFYLLVLISGSYAAVISIVDKFSN